MSYVVEGSVRPFGDQIRLIAQLNRDDGFHVWSETFDLPANSSPAEQDETIRTVGLMVHAYVNLDQQLRDARTETANDEAYRHYAAAARLRLQINTGGTTQPNAGRQILEEVDRAIALDPSFAAAHAQRASSYMNQVDGGVRWTEAGPEARRSIEKALALRPDSMRLVPLLALIQIKELDLTAAQQTLERGRSLNPDQRYLDEGFATLAMVRGRVAEAMRYWQQDIELDPYNNYPHQLYGLLLVRVGDFAAAEREFDAASRLNPGAEVGISLNRVLLAVKFQGDVEKARAVFEPVWDRYQHIFPRAFGFPLAALGHEKEARELLASMLRDPKADPYPSFMTYYGLNDYDSALDWLRRAIDDRNYIVLQSVRLPNAYPGLSEQTGYAEVLKHLDSLQRSP